MQAHFRHNTLTIIAVDEAACEMFRCDRRWLLDRSLLDLIADEDFRGLAKWRLKHIRDKGDLSPQKLPLMRADGSVFYGESTTQRINDHEFESTVKYLYEY